MKHRFLTAGLLLALAHPACALEYRTTSRAALLYDAPSQAGAKVAIAGSGLPLEVIIETAGWIKVRDHSGRLAWIEQSALGGAKRVMVKADTSSARQQPRDRLLDVFRPQPAVEPEGQLRGPVVQENLGKTAPARTYQDLLKDPRDEALFEHYVSAQPLRVTVDGKTQEIGARALITGIEPSPDGRFLLVTSVHRPFSYRVPFYYFPERSEVWDLDGKLVKLVADTPLQEGVPITYDSVPIGPRSMTWRDDMPATLIWAEAQDGGDAAVDAAVRDHVLTLAAPFQGEPQLLLPLGYRYAGADWTTDGRALISDRVAWSFSSRVMFSAGTRFFSIRNCWNALASLTAYLSLGRWG